VAHGCCCFAEWIGRVDGGSDRARLDELVGPGNAVSDFHNSNNWMRARIAD